MWDVVIAGLSSAAPILADLRSAWKRRRAKNLTPAAAAKEAPLGTEAPAPLPPAWSRWAGARPEPRGAPRNSILQVRGLASASPGFRAGLLDLADEMGIPVDSLAVMMSSESGFRSDALNPLPAAGLIQLTVGANLPGYGSADAIHAVTKMSAEEQLERVVRPYYARMPGARGAHPGHLYMLNFLPARAGQPEETILGRKDAQGFEGEVYRLNSGFDTAKKGTITIGDVYAAAAAIARGAQGRRIAADGRVLEPAAAPAQGAK